jgi:glyceraldehyde 3-phosphate dehydrogenase
MSSYSHINNDTHSTPPPRKKSKTEESSYENDFKLAESVVPVLRKLWNEKQLTVYAGSEELTHSESASQIIKAIAKSNKKLRVKDVCDSIQALPSANIEGVAGWVDVADSKYIDASVSKTQKRRDVVLYGFGRIGRLLARLMLERESKCGGPVLRAIVVRKKKQPDLFKRADLLLHDSVHGEFSGTVSIDEDANAIVANGKKVQIIYSPGPDKVDYTAYGINDAIVVDNTGIWRDQSGLSLHLKSKGISKVLLTAPGKGVVNIVEGINDVLIRDQSIVSAASCSTFLTLIDFFTHSLAHSLTHSLTQQ